MADRAEPVLVDPGEPALRLVLASGSPRRKELLARAGVRARIVVPQIDETPRAGEEPTAYVERLARAKAESVAAAMDDDQALVLGADTTVALSGSILGKPVDAADARVMLRALSGRTHQVHTGVAVVGDSRTTSSVTTSEVTFRALTQDEIDAYVDTGDPLDKAGAYGIQGVAGQFVETLVGSASNVVGLPVAQTLVLLAEAGHPAFTWGPPRSH